MNKAISIVCALIFATALLAGTALAADTDSAVVTGSRDELQPAITSTSPDRLEIRLTYFLDPDTDPGLLPRDAFERDGYSYECADILRDVIIGDENKPVAVIKTAESEKNDIETVLAVLPQYIEYSDEEGYTGQLLLDTASVTAEVAGYGSYSTAYSVTRSYPNLSNADTQYIPKTIEDGSRTLQLQGVEWRTDNTYNVDDYEIGSRYTAVATYGGTRTSSYVLGYDITAGYDGVAVRKGTIAIKYTVIYAGAKIPEPEPPAATIPEPPTQPAASEPPPATEPLPEASATQPHGSLMWLPILISALALLGCGASVYLALKNRKERKHYEEANTDYYHYPDAHDSVDDSIPGNGDGDI